MIQVDGDLRASLLAAKLPEVSGCRATGPVAGDGALAERLQSSKPDASTRQARPPALQKTRAATFLAAFMFVLGPTLTAQETGQARVDCLRAQILADEGSRPEALHFLAGRFFMLPTVPTAARS